MALDFIAFIIEFVMFPKAVLAPPVPPVRRRIA
jgi:hypothetical protein